MDELRLKNALRCQVGKGKKYCRPCPYRGDNECDVKKIVSDVLLYLESTDRVVEILQEQITDLLTTQPAQTQEVW